jgi:hypothetical protein
MNGRIRLKPHLLFLIVNLALIGWLFAQTRTIDAAGNYAKLSDINQLKTHSLGLDRSIFELNVEWLSNYDPIVDRQKRRNAIIDRLDRDLQDVEEGKRAKEIIDRINSITHQRDIVVEKVKTLHAQIKNSSHYLPLLMTELNDKLAANGGSVEEQSTIARLGDLIAIYKSDLSDDARRDVKDHLAGLEDQFRQRTAVDPDLEMLVGSLVQHARII